MLLHESQFYVQMTLYQFVGLHIIYTEQIKLIISFYEPGVNKSECEGINNIKMPFAVIADKAAQS